MDKNEQRTVERCVPIKGKGTRVYTVIVVIVPLHEKIIERGISNDNSHIWFRDRTLRCTGNIILVIRIGSKVLTEGCDHGRVILAVPIIQLDIKIESVHKDIPKGPVNSGIARVA